MTAEHYYPYRLTACTVAQQNLARIYKPPSHTGCDQALKQVHFLPFS